MTGLDHDGEGGRGGRGGGRVRLHARGPMHLGHDILVASADGGRGQYILNAQGGGGSGGSVHLKA